MKKETKTHLVWGLVTLVVVVLTAIIVAVTGWPHIFKLKAFKKTQGGFAAVGLLVFLALAATSTVIVLRLHGGV